MIQVVILLQVVRKHYDHFATREALLRIKFGRSEITLDIPVDGLVTKNGWTITPLTYPTVRMKLRLPSFTVTVGSILQNLESMLTKFRGIN